MRVVPAVLMALGLLAERRVTTRSHPRSGQGLSNHGSRRS